MVHRRLLTVMLLLLVGLVIASAVTPPPERRQDAGTQTTATTATTPSENDDEPTARTSAPAGVAGVLPRDRTISARPGQAVDLRVTAPEPATIAIPALAALQPATPGTPAQFIVAFDRAGRYEVRNLDTGDDIGAIVVE
jgi:hypothetical protein